MNTENIEILDLIPQRPPFLLVDKLVDFEPVLSVTSFEVPADGILVRDGCLSEAGLMENIAQSCAARIGYVNRFQKSETVKLGIIGAVKDFKVDKMPPVGSKLRTEIEVLNEVFGITLVNANVLLDGTSVASCQMKISLTDIEQQG